MQFITALFILAIMPLKNYTNYSLIEDFDVKSDNVYLATNGGVVSFSDIELVGNSAYFDSFKIFTSANGFPHNTILSIVNSNDTIWTVVKNSGLFYKLPENKDFKGYFIPYAGIKNAKKVRKYENVLFLQLTTSIIRIKINPNPYDDNIYIICHDSTGIMDILQDSLYYSIKDTLFIQNVFNNFSQDTIISPSIITSVVKGRFLYIGTENGIYEKDSVGLIHYNTGYTYRLYEKNDTIFAACSQGAFIIHEGILEKIDKERSYALFKFKGHIFTNRITSPQNIYYNGGLFVKSDTGFLPLPKGIPTNLITTMAIDGKNLYVGTLDWGDRPKYLPSKAFYIKGEDGMPYFVDSIGNTISDAIRIVKYGNGKVFFGAYAEDSRGLFIYDHGKVMHLTDFPSLLFNDLWVKEDTFIALWGDGIYRWRGESKFLLYDVNYPSFIELDTLKRLWIGTEASGIVVVDTQGNVIRAINYELPSPAITGLLRVGDMMAVGTDRGLVLFNKDFVPYNVITGPRIRSLAEDKYKRLYALSDSALYFINTNSHTYKVLLTSPPIVPINAPDWEVRNVLAIDNNLNMYIGSKEGILVVKLDEPKYGKSSIRIFPNPVEEGSSVTVCASFSFKVISINGKKIGSFTKGCHIMKTDELSPGLYEVITSSGEREKFVIKGKK